MAEWQDEDIQAMVEGIRKLASSLADAPAHRSAAPLTLHKLASTYTDLVYAALAKQAAGALPEDIEHPFRHYWTKRLGGAALGGAVGALAGGHGSRAIIGGLAGAFAGEKLGEIGALHDHYKTVNRFDEMGVSLPDAVRHPHLHGMGAHQAAVHAMNQQASPFAIPPGGF